MDDKKLLRYSRQIMLPKLDIGGQENLLKSHVLLIGVGGLGSAVAMYLAAGGVGTLTLVDDDDVDLSNLQRQIIHSTGAIGLPKVDSAKQKLHGLNPDIEVIALNRRLNDEELAACVRRADVVVDASDNFATRFQINSICVQEGRQLVSGAAIRMEGQLSVFAGHLDDMPCYRCLYRDETELAASCSETGVLAPLVGIIGSMQAVETMKLLVPMGQSLLGRLLVLDAMTMELRSLRLSKDPACPVCN